LIKNLDFATFAFHEEYEEKLPVKVVFKPKPVLNPIAKIIADHNLKQLHIAETEKYAHVTYFFNGGHQEPYPQEERRLIPSPKVATYDLKPEMSALHTTEELLAKFRHFDFVVINFANADMVGHTGNLKAAIKACEIVDECVGRITAEALKEKYVILITADHGNAEQMINPNNGEPHTEHTTNPVPFILISDNPNFQNPLRTANQHGLILSDVAPTILKIMGLEIPKDITGQSLI
jgi:2,3-bisphosphoglycerate-independent phosphoglycerate mutase